MKTESGTLSREGTPADASGSPPTAEQIKIRRRNWKLGFLALVGIAFIAAAIMLRTVLTPVLISLVLAYVADPFLAWCEEHRVRRWVATILVYLVCLALVALSAAFLGPRLVNQTQRLYRYVSGVARNYGNAVLESGNISSAGTLQQTEDGSPEMTDGAGQEDSDSFTTEPNREPPVKEEEGLLSKWRGPIADWEVRTRNYLHSHADEMATRVAAVAVAVIQNTMKGLSSAASFILGLILVLVFTFFFMLNFRRMTSTVKSYIPALHRDRTLKIIGRIDSAVSNFFRGRLLVCLISGIVYCIGLRSSGIDFWLLIGLAGGILGFIPFIGVILPIIPACVFALLTSHPLGSLIGVLVTFSIVQWIVEPLAGTMILSHHVKMHPVTLLLALLIGGYLFGIFGVLLSVPLAAVVKILSEEFILPPLHELATSDDQ